MDKKEYENATHCHICDGEFVENGHKEYKKVLDHCHLTGKYRGAAHNKCNLKLEIPKFIPVIIHNLSGYDSHLFIKNLNKTEGKISCLANTEEKYITFSKDIVTGIKENGKPIIQKIRFIDSFKFYVIQS